MKSKKTARRRRARRSVTTRLVLSLGLLTLFLVMAALLAWQSDDAYIAWRTADNMLAGRGLTYNPGERTQVFTSPLWFFVGAACQFIFGEIYYSVIFVSLVIVGATLALLFKECEAQGPASAILVFLGVGSSTVLDFSTSGLETPLLALLVVAFSLAVVRRDVGAALFRAVLLFLCRPDTLVLSALPLTFLVWDTKDRRSLLREARVPLLLLLSWMGFATFYFGSPIPNSAIAKLNSHAPLFATWAQGLLYLVDFASHEPVMALFIVGLSAFSFARGEPAERALAGGIWLHLLYIVWVGGDFMRGRFLWVPIWGSFFLLVALVSKIPRRWLEGGALVALAAAVMPWSPVFDVDPKGGGSLDLENGIVHERAFYAEFTSLLSVLYRSDIIEKYELPVPPYESSIECAEHRGKGRSYAYRTQVGFCGYFGGPDLMVFDWTAVTDPFLARVPYIPREECRAGHLYRHNVDEYVRRRRGQLARFSDPGVEDAYQDVVLVTRGKLFSARRLGALARLTLGFHRDAFTRFEEAGEELPASLPTKKRVVGAPDE